MHVRYVARPDLIGARYRGLSQKIGIGAELVAAIRRSGIPLAALDQQLVLTKQRYQSIPTYTYPSCLKHQMKLTATHSGVLAADIPDHSQNILLFQAPSLASTLLLVVPLAADPCMAA